MNDRLLARALRRSLKTFNTVVCLGHSLAARSTGVVIGSGVRLHGRCEVALTGAVARHGVIVLGKRTVVERGVLLHPYGGRIETGIDVYIGPYTTIYGHGGVVIGKDTLISMHCRILSSEHTIGGRDTIIRSRPDQLEPTRIGADVWLGAGVTVLGGVEIGDGCVVGAGAVVTRDLPAYSRAIGVPARWGDFRR
jgi:carbonic anhydrase/acetyltransferase-like protein (isoleucine patch superfamily)